MPPRFWDAKDTIVARATAEGGGPRGVIRISGPDSLPLLQSILTAHGRSEAASKLGKLKRAETVNVDWPLPTLAGSLPAELLVWPDQRSYTRQPSVEIHTLGSPPILDAIQQTICDAGGRMAEPGEFTLRAFLAGRLDLTQAEAVLAVIDAEDQDSLKTALGQLAGGLATPLDELRNQLIDLLAHLEAGLDFADEDIEFISSEQLGSDLRRIASQLESIRRQLADRADRATLPRVALAGEPNAGKSSLFNALLGESAAIVSPQRGATRDYVSGVLSLTGGGRCLLLDTAGEDREASGPDAVAQRQRAAALRNAALVLHCLEPGEQPPSTTAANMLLIATKADLSKFLPAPGAIPVSVLDGNGLEALRDAIAGQLAKQSNPVLDSAARCEESLDRATAALGEAIQAAQEERGEELVAAELRLTLDELGRIVGAIYNDDILDRVFSRFCIGK